LLFHTGIKSHFNPPPGENSLIRPWRIKGLLKEPHLPEKAADCAFALILNVIYYF